MPSPTISRLGNTTGVVEELYCHVIPAEDTKPPEDHRTARHPSPAVVGQR
jgi:hypothetical protein